MKLTAPLFVVAALSALAAPQVLAGPAANLARTAATSACKTERAALGTATFRATYGKTAMRTCRVGLMAAAREAVRVAARECRDERRADPQGFRATYGTNGNGANAFGRCVLRTAKQELRDEVRATVNAAKECKAERQADPQAFRATYGKNGNGANAFGKCVSGKKGGEDPEDPEPAEDPELPEPSEG